MSIELVWMLGAGVAFLYLAVVLQLFHARRRNRRRSRRQERIEQVWLPILTAGPDESPGEVPALRARDAGAFMILWNQLQESFVGDIKIHLNDVARRAGIDRTARRMLERGNLRSRLLAVSTLGHLGDRLAWEPLTRLMRHHDQLLSLAAARALTRIDAEAALPVVLPCVADRHDWSRNYVLGMLAELGADVVSQPLTAATRDASLEHAQRLLQYFSVAHLADALPVVRAIIGRTDDVECVTACLRVFADVDDLETVREYLDHPSWQVRVQAVNVIGRFGSASDYRRLASLLADPEWWVRYRAAQALCALPGTATSTLEQLSVTHTDPFARDMLVQVLAEARA
jgi:HEAT repeat protein